MDWSYLMKYTHVQNYLSTSKNKRTRKRNTTRQILPRKEIWVIKTVIWLPLVAVILRKESRSSLYIFKCKSSSDVYLAYLKKPSKAFTLGSLNLLKLWSTYNLMKTKIFIRNYTRFTALCPPKLLQLLRSRNKGKMMMWSIKR